MKQNEPTRTRRFRRSGEFAARCLSARISMLLRSAACPCTFSPPPPSRRALGECQDVLGTISRHSGRAERGSRLFPGRVSHTKLHTLACVSVRALLSPALCIPRAVTLPFVYPLRASIRRSGARSCNRCVLSLFTAVDLFVIARFSLSRNSSTRQP